MWRCLPTRKVRFKIKGKSNNFTKQFKDCFRQRHYKKANSVCALEFSSVSGLKWRRWDYFFHLHPSRSLTTVVGDRHINNVFVCLRLNKKYQNEIYSIWVCSASTSVLFLSNLSIFFKSIPRCKGISIVTKDLEIQQNYNWC